MRHIRPIRFTRTAAESAPNAPGVYILWNVTAIGSLRPIYVGVSKKSIRTRLCKHFDQSHNEDLNLNVRALGSSVLFCWLSTRGSRAKYVESHLIRRLKPRANIQENQ
jgi:excinuclease UvrABC nuclease subunit